MNNITVSILYDNMTMDENMQCGWGFSVLVKTPDSNVLFDTGEDGKKLLANCQRLEVNPADIDSVVISHTHSDHTGGLAELLRKNSDVTLYLPGDTEFKGAPGLDVHIAHVFNPTELETCVYSTGILGNSIKEHSLILHTANGIVLLTGCAHPGILEIIQTAISQFPYEPLLHVIGGLHLYNTKPDAVESLVRECMNIGIQTMSPGHCSGEHCREIMKKNYKENYYQIGSGAFINFPARRCE